MRKLLKLRQPIKTNISNLNDLYDKNGQWLPPGNYYFNITEMGDRYAHGELNCKGFRTKFTFKIKDVVKMMAIAQSRLARRAQIDETMMPKFRSPNSSIELDYPTKIIKKKTQSICTICLELIENDNNCKTLSCNHKFHISCISQWYNKKKTCPVCRKNITSLNYKARYSPYKYYNNSYII